MKGGSEYHLMESVIPFGAMVEYHPISARVNTKEVLTPMSGEKFIFPIRDGTVQLSG